MSLPREPAWALARISLFPKDFSYATASADMQSRFRVALYHTRGWSRLVPLTAEPRETWPDALALYECRVTQRGEPHGFFGATGLCVSAAATMESAEPAVARSCFSFADVRAEIRPTAAFMPKAERDQIALSSAFVPSGHGGVVFRPAENRWELHAVQITLPEELRDVLRGRDFTTDGLDARLREIDASNTDREELRAALFESEVLGETCSVVVENGEAWRAADESVTRLLGEGERAFAARVAAVAAEVPEDKAIPLRAACSFREAAAFPRNFPEGAPAKVAAFLLSMAQRVNRVAPYAARLDTWLDGRWIALSELERYAGWIVRAPSPKGVVWDKGLLDALRFELSTATRRGDSAELSRAGLNARSPISWTGFMQCGFREDTLVDTELLSVHPYEFAARYARLLPDLDTKLLELSRGAVDDETECIVLAHAGAATLGEVAQASARGLWTLDFCGRGRVAEKSLRLEDIEVTSDGERILFRRRATGQRVRIMLSAPYNLEHPSMHPLVTLLGVERLAESEIEFAFERAMQGLPLVPRISYEGHVIARRKLMLPKRAATACNATALRELLDEHSMGDVVAEGASLLTFDARVDSPPRRDVIKRWAQGESLVLREHIETDGVLVDGAVHAARLLVPIVSNAKGSAQDRTTSVVTKRVAAPPGRNAFAYRGPFSTLRLTTTAERVSPLLSMFNEDGLFDDRDWFFVALEGESGLELRLRLRTLEERDSDTSIHALFRAGERACTEGLARTYAIEPYLREWERYGGARGVDLAEGIFIADSKSLFDFATTHAVNAVERLDVYALYIIQLLSLAKPDASPLDHVEFLRSCFAAYAKELKLDTSFRKEIALRYRERARGLRSAYLGAGDEWMFRALSMRAADVKEVLARHDDAPATVQSMLASLIHMTGTRLFYEGNRPAEAKAYYYAYRLIEALAATGAWPSRRSVSDAPAPSRGTGRAARAAGSLGAVPKPARSSDPR